jgi:hypothetical protein
MEKYGTGLRDLQNVASQEKTKEVLESSVADPRHFDVIRNSAFHSDADPDLPFNLMRIRILPLTFSRIWTLPMLQNDHLRLSPFHFDADPNPAFDADSAFSL